MRIAISPDENPGDTGSVSAGGVTERSVNVAVATALQAALTRCGQDAWFDPTITYIERVNRANADGSALLVACAHNESTRGLSGTQFVFCGGGQTFGRQAAAANAVYAALAKIAGWPPRRADAVEAVYECCAFDGDTVYTEYLFMSPDDEPLWSRPDYPQLAAEATARGLAATYGFPYIAPAGGVFVALTDDQQANLYQAVMDIHDVAAKLDNRVFGDILNDDVGLGQLNANVQAILTRVSVSAPGGGGLTADQAAQLAQIRDGVAKIEAGLRSA